MTAHAENLLVVAIDRLNAGCLGPYGNSAVPTQAFNRLAAESWLAEWHFTTSTDLPGWYRSVWQGLHPLSPDKPTSTLGAAWRDAGRTTLLVSDNAKVAALPGAETFADKVVVTSPLAISAARETQETQAARLFDTAIDRLSQLPRPFALWLHSSGMNGPWDAPPELREHMRGDDDPPAATFIDPPALTLPADFDPDELLPITQAYAAQVLAIDECLELLLDSLAEMKLADSTLVVVTAPRGYLLGQQGHVGTVHDALLEDLLHVPLFIRWPGQTQAAARSHALLQPRDLYPLLLAPDEWQPVAQDRIFIRSEAERALRTIAWHWRETAGDEQQLYAKPDDRYEVNDVARRNRTSCQHMLEVADITAAAIASDNERTLPPLDETLSDTIR